MPSCHPFISRNPFLFEFPISGHEGAPSDAVFYYQYEACQGGYFFEVHSPPPVAKGGVSQLQGKGSPIRMGRITGAPGGADFLETALHNILIYGRRGTPYTDF